MEGVSASETQKLECTIAENAEVRTCKCKEILTLILCPFSKEYELIT